MPEIPGVLLVLVGIGSFAKSYETLLAVHGELMFAYWLRIRGVDEVKGRVAALQSEHP